MSAWCQDEILLRILNLTNLYHYTWHSCLPLPSMTYMTTFPALRTWDFDEADWLASLSTGEKCLIKRLQDFAPFTWNVPPDSRERSTSMVWVEPTHHKLISSWEGPEKMTGYSWHAQLRQQEINKHQTISKRHPNSNKTLAFGRRQTSKFLGVINITNPKAGTFC